MQPLRINEILIPASELSWTAVRASGAGGQNVNKVASKVELRFHISSSVALDNPTKMRLLVLGKFRVDTDGWLHIISQKTRDQSRNLQDAREKLADLILCASQPPRLRIPTKIPRSVVARRLQNKNQKGQKKQLRRKPPLDE